MGWVYSIIFCSFHRHIAAETRQVLEKIQSTASELREEKIMGRKELWDKIDFTDKQLDLLTHEMKEKIRQMVEDVEGKISKALSEEIRRLGVLVDEFSAPFHSDQLVLNVYKKELHSYVESGLGSNLRARLSTALALNIENSQREMTGKWIRVELRQVHSPSIDSNNFWLDFSLISERMSNLLPADKKMLNLLPRREPFEVLYRLNCDNLCGDFKEDIGFKFSFGFTAFINRCLGKQGRGFFQGLHSRPESVSP